jgi:hypothetical protein
MVEIEDSGFGSITIDEKRYGHDVWVFSDGSVEERRGGYHTFLKKEVQALLKGEVDTIVVGAGTAGCVEIESPARQLAQQRGIEIVSDITPKAIEKYNQLVTKGRKVAAAFHVTC